MGDLPSFSPDGRYVVTGAIDRSIRVFATEGMAKETAQWGPDARVHSTINSEQQSFSYWSNCMESNYGACD